MNWIIEIVENKIKPKPQFINEKKMELCKNRLT